MFSDLSKRCIELSFRHKLTHVSSVLNTVDLLDEIYKQRADNDPVVLGNGHAGLALYVVLESRGKCDAEEMIRTHGTHPSRDVEHGIYVSSGSLGQAETVAVGMALADRSRSVWLLTSDGACMEGSTYEAFRVADKFNIHNLKIFIIYNGLGAYGGIDSCYLPHQSGIHILHVNQKKYPQWLRGLAGHYLTLTEEQYDELMA